MTQNDAKTEAKSLRISTASVIMVHKEEEKEDTNRVVEAKAKSDGERKSDDTQR